MKINRLFLLLLLFPFFLNGNAQSITVRNKSNQVLNEFVAEIPVNKIKLPLGNYIAVSEDGVKLPVELVNDLRGNEFAIFPIDKLEANASRTFKIQRGTADAYPKRTYAELSHKIGNEAEMKGNKVETDFSWVKPNYMYIPGDFRDHAYHIKYEGPGWESDKVGYRFYIDQRNAIDAFGKKVPGIVLPAVGVDGYDNYHNMAKWGMDNMKVGKTLGIGSIGYFDGKNAVRVEKRDSVIGFIPADRKLRSQVNTTYFGWDVCVNKFTLKSLISIDAGTKASRMELLADRAVDNLTTGIIKSPGTVLIKSPDTEGDWAYLATFGKQSLNDDNLGFAIFYKKKQLKSLTEDAINHLVVLKPENGYAEYYFMASWEMDWDPAKNKSDFLKQLEAVLLRLNNPVSISFKKR